MLTAAVTVFWAFFYPRDALAMDHLVAVPWYVALILAYLAGISAQAFASRMENWLGGRLLLDLSERSLDPELRALVAKARDLLNADGGLDFSKARLDWLFRVCDEALAQSERAPDRETYRYREGLFRGLAVSFLALAAAVRAAIPNAALQIDKQNYPVAGGMVLTVAAVALLIAALCFLRFRDIRRKRFARAITGFVVLRTFGSDAEKATP